METIGLQAYAQRNPISEYRIAGSDLFDESADMLRRGVLKAIIYKNPYQKGYEAIKTLSEVLVKDQTPKAESITVPISVILRNNLMFFEEFI